MEVEIGILDDGIMVRKPDIGHYTSPEVFHLIKDMFIGLIDKNKKYVHHLELFKYCISDGDKLEIVIAHDHWMLVRILNEKSSYPSSQYSYMSGSEVIDILRAEFDELEYGIVSQ